VLNQAGATWPSAWDHRPAVRADGKNQIGHAGVVLSQKIADRVGLATALSAALPQDTGSGWRGRPMPVPGRPRLSGSGSHHGGCLPTPDGRHDDVGQPDVRGHQSDAGICERDLLLPSPHMKSPLWPAP
jgi:hypothetical protein